MALRRVTDRKLHAVIFGGALRDLMTQGPSAEPRDVDIVIDGASIEELSVMFADVLVRRTRFGGLHLNVKGWMVDVWPLSETWAFQQFPIGGRDFEALTRTTFLNVEAVTIDLSANRRARKVNGTGFFEALRSGVLDINLEENPFPELASIRALITASKLRYGLSTRLARYVIHYARKTPLEQFVDIQFNHYGFVRCSTETIHNWAKAIADQMRTRSVIVVPRKDPTQLLLWNPAETTTKAGDSASVPQSARSGAPEFLQAESSSHSVPLAR
jgi:hypothetical protein